MNNIRVLLVDDDEDDYIFTRDLLQDALYTNYELDWTTDGRVALEDSVSKHYDVALVDYRLGEERGTDILRSAQEIGVSIPFILFTGDNSVEIDREALEIGASDYLVKSEITVPLLDRAIRYAIERKKSEAQLLHLAQYDSLTGLLNRASFHAQLISSIAQARRSGDDWGLFVLDLDGFKSVNDTLGHPVGDGLLRMVAVRLRESLRDSDIIARLGGDEFAIIGSHLNAVGGAAEVAGKIVSTLSAPFTIQGEHVQVGASVGITVFCIDGESADQLMKNADLALYDAKRGARGSYRFYDVEMNSSAQTRKALAAELQGAIANGELGLCYQPKVETHTGFIVGVEALARWRHPEKGDIPPSEFIPIAEATGAIGPLGDWVLESVCRQIKDWTVNGLRPLPVAINLSTIQLKCNDFLDRVIDTLNETGVDPTMLEFELTESMIMQDPPAAAKLMRNLKELGVTLAIDDFGVGHSSLSYLMQFPVDKLKIDRSFVSRVIQDQSAAAIARTIVTLAKNLNLKIVAEGVETRDQYEFCKAEECDEIQGFYFCHPLAADSLMDRYKARSLLDVVLNSGMAVAAP